MGRRRALAAIALACVMGGVAPSPANAQVLLELSYDALGRVATTRDGESRTNTYLPAGLGYGGYQDPRGGVVQIVYDTDDKPIAQIDELGRTTRSKYDARGRVSERISPEGDRVVFGYDTKNNVTSLQKFAKPGSPEAGQTQVVTATYDTTWNKPSSITDARNGVTTFTYVPVGSGGAGELATQSMPTTAGGSSTYSFSYNGFGQIVTSADPTNVVVASAYQSSPGRFLSTITLDPGGIGATLSFATNTAGDVTQVDGPRTDAADVNNTTYDAARRPVLELAPDPGNGQRTATKTSYNARGLVATVERGYVSSGVFAALESEASLYDNAGNMIRATTPAGVTQVEYDELDRVTCTAIRMNPATYASLPSSACSMTAAGAFGPDQISRTGYDAAGQLVSVEIGVGAQEKAFYARYTYTANGKQSTITDGNINKTGYIYDGFDRLKQIRFPHRTQIETVSADDYEEYSYDLSDNRTSWRRRDGQVIAFQYDAMNRMTLKDLPNGTSLDVYYTYDLASRTTGARFGSAGGQGIVTGYDTAGRKTSETTFGRQIGSLYDKAGNRIRITWPDGTYFTYDYDAVDRLTHVRENGAAALASFTYGVLDRRSQLSRANGTQTTYGYDIAGRLSTLSHIGTPSALNSHQTLSYTPSNQVASLTQATPAYVWTGQPSNERTYTHDGLNRIATIAALPGGYDSRGNLAYDGQRSFSYDVENKLIAAAGGGAPMSLSYDPAGRLFETNVSGALTRFLYDGDKLVAEYDGGSGSLLQRYVHSNDVDEPLVWYQGPGTSDRRFLHSDRLGSVIAWTTASGTPTIYTYGPYGEPQDWQGSRFRYTGQIALSEAQLYHYKARAYDPILGRFLQTDPIDQDDDVNLYAYVKGDATNSGDSTGTCPSCVGAIAGAIVGGGVEALVQIHQNGRVKDWGAVGVQTGIGALAGATGAGAGALAARTVTVIGVSRATVAATVGGAVSGATQEAASKASQGKAPTAGGVVKSAAAGAAVGPLARTAVNSGAKGLAAGRSAAAQSRVSTAARSGVLSGKLTQSGALAPMTSKPGGAAVAGATSEEAVSKAAELRDRLKEKNR